MSKEKPAINPLLLNKEIAYAGEIGRKRRDFCIEFIKKKQGIIKEIQDSQLEAVKKNGQKITCHKGCDYCCHFYMHANIQECEAIVYYLYNNKSVYDAYIENYTEWREKLSKNGDIFKNCARLWYEKGAQGAGQKEEMAFSTESNRYRDQDIACPFLVDGACSIYEVRPYLCVGTVSSSPSEWCAKSSANTPNIYKTQTSAVFDKSFYYKELNDFIFTFFPLTIYYILEGGYEMLAMITGLTDLEDIELNDPEVKCIMGKLSV
ncbi:MAG: hypothetical protein PHF74_07810 [Dehalococcoidales bacterium]|nr:hypothetical protein [Dehalococcoidales bacterium]